MKQRLDKEERLAQQADTQALARRSFLQRAAGLAAVTAMAPAAFARNFGPSTEPQRYPDPDIIALDKRFKYKLGNTPIQRLYTGTLWAEAAPGTARAAISCGATSRATRTCATWRRTTTSAGCFVIRLCTATAIPLTTADGKSASVTARVTCAGTTQRSVTILAAKNDEGKEFNAPNDGMVHPNDGSVWFTDPGYGALMNYEGKRYSTDNVQPFIKRPCIGSRPRAAR